MKARFLFSRIWPGLTKVAESSKGPSAVAVAYFGKGAAKLLPLKPGSVLVVDASEAAVKAGVTHPDDLKSLQKRGVRILSAKNLHAKVFVFGKLAIVGSMNVSKNSAEALVEAAVETTDPGIVRVARKFVLGLTAVELGPERLESLQELYRPPNFAPRAARRSARGKPEIEVPELRVVQLVSSALPELAEKAMDEGRSVAASKQEHPRKFSLHEFWWRGRAPFAPGMMVIQVVADGKCPKMVSRPGMVVHVRRWRSHGKLLTFVYVEVPRGRPVRLDRLKGRLGSEGVRRLKRGGRVNSQLALRLLRAWEK